MINGAKISAQCYANAGPDQYFCCGGTTTLSATFNATNVACTCTNVSYAWTPTVGLSNPNIPNPTATISNITYVVCITSYTSKHCASCNAFFFLKSADFVKYKNNNSISHVSLLKKWMEKKKSKIVNSSFVADLPNC